MFNPLCDFARQTVLYGDQVHVIILQAKTYLFNGRFIGIDEIKINLRYIFIVPDRKNLNNMKYIFILICLHGSVYSFGQTSFGVKGGFNFNSIHFEDYPAGFDLDAKPNIGFHLGVFGIVPLTEQLSFIPEAQFTKRGVSSSGDYRLNLYYFEVPLLLSYSPLKWLSIDGGANAAIKISAVIKSDTGVRNKIDAYDTFDFGLTAGARFHLHNKISIVARYYFGLTAIDEVVFRDSNNSVLARVKEYNRGGQLGISYLLK